VALTFNMLPLPSAQNGSPALVKSSRLCLRSTSLYKSLPSYLK